MIRSYDDLHMLLNCRVRELSFLLLVLLQSCSGTGSLEEQRKSDDIL